jgi:hypothetical protein
MNYGPTIYPRRLRFWPQSIDLGVLCVEGSKRNPTSLWHKENSRLTLAENLIVCFHSILLDCTAPLAKDSK